MGMSWEDGLLCGRERATGRGGVVGKKQLRKWRALGSQRAELYVSARS